MSGWIVEVLDRQHRVAQRVPVATWPVTLGRGYGCEVIVDDPHVAPRHAELMLDAETGALRVTDLGSRNGLRRPQGRDGRSGVRETGELTVRPGEWIETGRTRWRVCEPGTPVADELPLDERWQVPAGVAALVLLAALASVALQSWFGSPDADSPVPLLMTVMAVLVGLLGWSAVWAALTRLWQPRAHGFDHLAWIAAAVLVVQALEWLRDTVAFAFDWPLLATWERPLELVCLTVLLMGHARIAVGHRPRWAGTAAVLLLVGGMGMSMLENWQSQRQPLPAQFMSVMRPPGWHLGREGPVEPLFEALQAQKADIDALRKVDGAADDVD